MPPVPDPRTGNSERTRRPARAGLVSGSPLWALRERAAAVNVRIGAPKGEGCSVAASPR